MSGGIFISYRREDSAPYARLLHRALRERFPGSDVFIDVDSIAVGVDFVEAIRTAIASSAVLIALVGPQWTTLTDRHGRRLDNPDDFVRMELETALAGGVRVFPVLVGEAPPLRPDELPPTLRTLARLNALDLNHKRYDYDVQLLLTAVERVLDAPAAEPPRSPVEELPVEEPPVAEEPPPAAEVPSFLAVEARRLAHPNRPRLPGAKRIRSVAFSPDGSLVASASNDQTVRVWQVGDGRQEAVLNHPAVPHAVVFGPRGDLLATNSADGRVRVWQLPGGLLRDTLAHAGPGDGLAWSPDGRLLAAAGSPGLRIWEMPAADRWSQEPDQPDVSTVAFTPDGLGLAVVAGARVTVRPLPRGPATFEPPEPVASVRRLLFGPDGQHLAADGSPPRLWRLPSGDPRRLSGPDSAEALAFSSDGHHLAVADGDRVRIWDLRGDEPEPVAELPHPEAVSALAFGPGGRFLAAGTAGNQIVLWEVAAGRR